MNALYLDIETRWANRYITVVGFYHQTTGLTQLLWPELDGESLDAALPQAEYLYTYNGNNFDLKVIERHLGLNLHDRFKSRDLMYSCWSQGLKGGLKAVERQLGIGRQQEPLSNSQIQQCWSRWKHKSDAEALGLLLKYNEEDVMNLVRLRQLLGA